MGLGPLTNKSDPDQQKVRLYSTFDMCSQDLWWRT